MERVETVGLGLYFEDLPLGKQYRTHGRTITRSDVIGFISSIGMYGLPFTDAHYMAHESDIKGEACPGLLVCGLAEGLLVQATMKKSGHAFLHMEWESHAPVFVGDTIHVECEVIERRESRSRPDRGLVRSRNRVFKQDGTHVQTYTPLRWIRLRPPPSADEGRSA
jgi:acyl dehydratase